MSPNWGIVGSSTIIYLPPDTPAPPSHFLAREVMIYSEGALVLAPPSIEPEGREPWRWLTSPWENPPQAPKPAVWQFLREQASPGAPRTQEMPGWEEIFRAIAPFGGLFKVMMAPPVDLDKYYRDIIQAAGVLGVGDPQSLLGLLWHAPHGDARTNPDRWQYLQNLLAGDNLKRTPARLPSPDCGPAPLGVAQVRNPLPWQGPQLLWSRFWGWGNLPGNCWVRRKPRHPSPNSRNPSPGSFSSFWQFWETRLSGKAAAMRPSSPGWRLQPRSWNAW